MPDPARPGVAYRLLDRWMRVVARLVPVQRRERWRSEWDGELWYGVQGKPGRPRWRAAAKLAAGLLRDALDARRLDTSGRRIHEGDDGDGMIRTVLADVRYSLRILRKAPGFTAVVAITLALGIGASVAVFSVVDAILLSPLPYPDADRLVMLWMGRRGADVDKDWFSGGQFTDIRTETRSFEEITFFEGGSSTLTGRGRAAEVGWLRAPSTYLRLLGARVSLGRSLDEQDDRADANRVALLTDGLWRRAFGADPDVVGQAVTLDGRDVEVAGVLSPDVLLDGEVMPTAWGNGRVDVVLSLPVAPGVLSDRLTEGYNIVGKLAPDVTLAQAQDELDQVAATVQRLHESDPDSGFFIRAVPLLDEVVGSVRRALLVLLASVGGVLLIACVNVANLLLARAAARRREMGVRTAMGAQRRRLVRQLLTESAVLAGLGGALGLGLAAVTLRTVRWAGEASLPRISEIGLDGRVLLFALAVTIGTCIVFGLVPAWRAARVDVRDSLKPGGRTTVGERSLWSRFSLSNALVVGEVSLSLVLLVGGGLLVRSFNALARVDPGFEAANRLTFRLTLSGDAYRDRAARIAFYEDLSERLSGLPGVGAVGATSNLPFDGSVSWAPIDTEDYVPPQGADHEIISEYRVTTPGYFEAMGIPVIRGRAFDGRDSPDDADVAIIDERFAETYFPERDPVGMRLVTWGPRVLTIVGVVGTVKHERLDADSRVTTYLPHAGWASRGMTMVVETGGDPEALVAAATGTVRELDDDIAVLDVRSMAALVASSLAERRFSMALLQILGGVALALATVGVYGLVSYRVHQGTRDLSLRIALGASTGTILRLVVRHGLGLAVAGVGVGLLAALVLTRFIRSMLYGVGPVDALTYAAVATGLVVTALVACYVPARRATRADPLLAISCE